MVSPLDPMFNNQPISMWDVLAEGLASQGVTPQSMMSYADVVPSPRRSGTGSIMRPNMGPTQAPQPQKPPEGSIAPYMMPPQEAGPKGKDQGRVLPPQQNLGPPVGWQGPLQPEDTGNPLDPSPAPQPEPGPNAPPGAPLDIRSVAQMAPPARQYDSTQMALAGLKAMVPEKAYIPPPPSVPRPDTGGLPRIDPMVVMRNLQTASGGQAPLLLLSQLLGRG